MNHHTDRRGLISLPPDAVDQFEANPVSVTELVGLHPEARWQEIIGRHSTDKELGRRGINVSNRNHADGLDWYRKVVRYVQHDKRFFAFISLYTLSLNESDARAFDNRCIDAEFLLNYRATQPVGYLEAQFLSSDWWVIGFKYQFSSSDRSVNLLLLFGLAASGEE